MNISTFTAIVGTLACDAKCPYCVSKMTPLNGIGYRAQDVNWRNFRKACMLAKAGNVFGVLLTGKGEPTLYPEQITMFMESMKEFNFPIIEMQTNAIQIGLHPEKYREYLKEWYDLGMTTIAISIAHYKSEKNKGVFSPEGEYPDMRKSIKFLHEIGFSIRLCCMLFKGGIDDIEKLKALIDFGRENKVEQLSVRSIEKPNQPESAETERWVETHRLDDYTIRDMGEYLAKNGKKLMTMPYGAVVYDVDGQNVCLTNCLTIKPETDELRQLIFFPDGHVRYDWQYKGATLI